MRSLLAVLLLSACGPMPGMVAANDPCSCDERGDYIVNERQPNRVSLVCTRIVNQLRDGGIDVNPCSGIECCRWRVP